MAELMYDLTAKERSNAVGWGVKQEQSFVALKGTLAKLPIRIARNVKKPFALRTASVAGRNV